MKNNSTDWTKYYKNKKSFISRINKKLHTNTFKKIVKYIPTNNLSILELGGGNSRYYELLSEYKHINMYVAVDNNEYGVKLFNEKNTNDKVYAICCDVFDYTTDVKYDVVMSFGLIEHFSKQGTADIIKKHFDLCKESGYVLITFPTPTIYYRIFRKVLEIFRKWPFHDERPLKLKEVYNECNKYGEIVYFKLNYYLGNTMYDILVKKNHN